jgi:hypothetical protein
MNYLKRMPDDILEMIYRQIHNDFMKNIKEEINDEFDFRWDHLSIDNKYNYIDIKYDEFNAIYCIHDENDELIRPDIIAFEGYYRLIQTSFDNDDDDDDDDENTFISHLMYNPSYDDILLEVENFINFSGDYNHRFLEDVYIQGFINDDTYGKVGILNVFLGS